jgi:hypothetical protein
LGDAIQFIRFAAPLRAKVARLFVEVPGCLVRLFQTIPEIDGVFTWEDPHSLQPEWDEQMEIMELPRYFRPTIDTVPAGVPYLFPPDGAAINEMAPWLRKVGLVWSSSNWKLSRSVPLRALLPVLTTPGCQMFSLQKGPVETEGVPQALVPRSLIADEDDVQTTASFIRQLDLVITVDTMVAHLAGALGKPVWLMLEKRADWRWMLDRDDSPWYPTLRIFRQTDCGDWRELGERVGAALRQSDLLKANERRLKPARSLKAAPLLSRKRHPSAGDIIAHRQGHQDEEPDQASCNDHFDEFRFKKGVHENRGDDGGFYSGNGDGDHHGESAEIDEPDERCD